MVLENVIAYVVVLGLPLWLVAEELLHRFAPGHSARGAATVRADAPAAERAGLERRAPEGAPSHAHASSV